MNNKANRTSKTLFFVDPGGVEETIKAVKRIKDRTSLTVVSLDEDTKDLLDKENIDSKCILSYLDKNFWEYVDRDATKWIDAWADKKIIGGRSIKEKFVCRGVSLWWFGRDILFSDAGGIFDVVSFINLFYKIFKIEKPSLVCFFGYRSTKFSLIFQIAKSTGIKFNDHSLVRNFGFVSSFTKSFERHCLTFGRALIRIFEILSKKIAFFIFTAKKTITGIDRPKNKKVLIIAHHANYARFYSVAGSSYVGDFYYRGIEELLREDKNLDLSVLSPATPRLEKNPFFSDLVQIAKGTSYLPVEAYVKTSFYIKSIFKKLSFKKSFKKIIVNPAFIESLDYKGINLHSILHRQLKRLFVSSFPSGILLLDIAESIIKKERPSIILTIYETSTDRKALEIIGRKKGIPILGLQHGVLSSFPSARFSYYHKPSDVWRFQKSDILSCPIADKTLVFGDYYKNLLIESGYPADKVISTGCPRFDYLFNYERKKSLENCRKFGINQNGKNILFLSEGLENEYMLQEIIQDHEKNIRSAKMILQSSPEDSALVIKVHPRDNVNNYAQIFKDFPDRTIQIIKNVDLADLIHCASVVVMKASTAGLEAAISKKPIIDLNLFNEPELADYYVKEGVALEAHDADSLKKALCDLLYNTPARKRLISNMDEFIEKFAFKSDGRSSERVKEVILQELKII